jgi:hypothetical protein
MVPDQILVGLPKSLFDTAKLHHVTIVRAFGAKNRAMRVPVPTG